MADLSLYQWLVLALLSIVALFAVVISFGLDRSLEMMTRRLESALGEVRRAVDETNSEILLLRLAAENFPNDYRES